MSKEFSQIAPIFVGVLGLWTAMNVSLSVISTIESVVKTIEPTVKKIFSSTEPWQARVNSILLEEDIKVPTFIILNLAVLTFYLRSKSQEPIDINLMKSIRLVPIAILIYAIARDIWNNYPVAIMAGATVAHLAWIATDYHKWQQQPQPK